MTMVICGLHGRQAGEKVSRLLASKHRLGEDISLSIRDFSFVIDEYECPFYGLEEEIDSFGEEFVNGEFLIKTEERLSELLGNITVMCLQCLKDAMRGRSLPSNQP